MTKRPTRAETVYARLRQEILIGAWPPGSRLSIGTLTSAFSVSMSVVREALTRLAGVGLVEAEPQHGFRVMTVSPGDLQNLTAARLMIEVPALRDSVVNGGVTWETDVLSAHHRMQRAPRNDPVGTLRVSEEWIVAHADFHASLLAACTNGRLVSMACELRDAAELYIRWAVPNNRTRDIAAEHDALLEAALAHEAERGGELLAAHINETSSALRLRERSEG